MKREKQESISKSKNYLTTSVSIPKSTWRKLERLRRQRKTESYSYAITMAIERDYDFHFNPIEEPKIKLA